MTASPDTIERIIDCLQRAARANGTTAGRRGNVVRLVTQLGDELMVTADLHGNRLNFDKLCRIADLGQHPRRHLVMQEVCHGGPCYPSGMGCMSHLLLEDVAALKTRFPDRFHFILSNHELAELTDYPISKNRRMLNLTFRQGLYSMYGDGCERVRRAYGEFLASCPLAVRSSDGVFVSHSLPEQTDLLGFDVEVLERPLTPRDLGPSGDAFRLVWGRDFRPANAAAFAGLVEARLLINGHEPCCQGFATPNTHQIILDCCGPAACYLILPIGRPVNQGEAVRRVRALRNEKPRSE
jgi:hypothetical protein